MIKNNIIVYAAVLGGTFLAVLGLIGFGFANFLGLQLSTLVNLVHLASGLVVLYLGLTSTSLVAARKCCFGISAFFGGLGLFELTGLIAGGLGNSLVHLAVGVGFVAAATIQPMRSALESPR
jgi:hypothetical protein